MYKEKGQTSALAKGAEMDAFKSQFKYFKSSSSILPLDKEDDILAAEYKDCVITPMPIKVNKNEGTTARVFGLKPASSWKVFQFTFPEGLIFIKNPFTAEGQRYWISTCLKDYVKPPHRTNITNLQSKMSSEKGRDYCSESGQDIYKHLRWVTFGYHHCWDTKIYTSDNKCDFPKDLRELTQYMAELLGFDSFEPEAAIVNYYHLNSTLSGHQDRSEETTNAPLFSISFGQAAIFLIGGETKDVRPTAVYLKSGDVVVMAGKSRKSFHAVPKILKTEFKPWESYENSSEPVPKKSKLSSTILDCPEFKINEDYAPLDSSKEDTAYWKHFTSEYAKRCRININVRQVFASVAYDNV